MIGYEGNRQPLRSAGIKPASRSLFDVLGGGALRIGSSRVHGRGLKVQEVLRLPLLLEIRDGTRASFGIDDGEFGADPLDEAEARHDGGEKGRAFRRNHEQMVRDRSQLLDRRIRDDADPGASRLGVMGGPDR